jgi:hypothetical protein
MRFPEKAPEFPGLFFFPGTQKYTPSFKITVYFKIFKMISSSWQESAINHVRGQ